MFFRGILALLAIAFKLERIAICQAAANIPYNLEDTVKIWQQANCIFPDKSIYSTDLKNSKLKACLPQETPNSEYPEDEMTKNTLCRSLLGLSTVFCINKNWTEFANLYLNPEALKNVNIKTDHDLGICSVLSKFPTQYTNFSSSIQCARICLFSSDGMKDICELFTIMYYQYISYAYKMNSHREASSSPRENLKPALTNDTESRKPDPTKELKTSPILEPVSTTQQLEITNSTPSSSTFDAQKLSTATIPVVGSGSKETVNHEHEPAGNKGAVYLDPKTTGRKETENLEIQTTPLIETTTLVASTMSSQYAVHSETVRVTPTASSTLSMIVKPTIQANEVAAPAEDSTTVDLDALPELDADGLKNDKIVDNDDDDDETADHDDKDGYASVEETTPPNIKVDVDQDVPVQNNQKLQKENVGQNIAKGKENKGDVKNAQTYIIDDTDESPGSGHFLAYFLTAVVICISGYVIYHNKQKILAFIIEGRNSGRNGRQRSKDVKYTQLKSNVEEVLPSLDQTATGKNFVY